MITRNGSKYDKDSKFYFRKWFILKLGDLFWLTACRPTSKFCSCDSYHVCVIRTLFVCASCYVRVIRTLFVCASYSVRMLRTLFVWFVLYLCDSYSVRVLFVWFVLCPCKSYRIRVIRSFSCHPRALSSYSLRVLFFRFVWFVLKSYECYTSVTRRLVWHSCASCDNRVVLVWPSCASCKACDSSTFVEKRRFLLSHPGSYGS